MYERGLLCGNFLSGSVKSEFIKIILLVINKNAYLLNKSFKGRRVSFFKRINQTGTSKCTVYSSRGCHCAVVFQFSKSHWIVEGIFFMEIIFLGSIKRSKLTK